MASLLEPYYARRMKTLSPENWDGFVRAIEAALAVLFEQLGIEREVTERIVQRGLQLIEDELAPVVTEAQNKANEITLAARDLGLLFRASSASSLAIGTGARTFIVSEGERNRFVAPLFVIASVDGDPSQWMAGQVTSWNVETGALAIDVIRSRGAGQHAAWDISIAGIPPDAPPSQSASNVTIDPISGLTAGNTQEALEQLRASMAPNGHSHDIDDVVGLPEALAGKADAAAVAADLAGKAPLQHDHSGQGLIPDTLRVTRAIQLADGADLNTVLTGGFYAAPNASNKPGTASWGFLLVQRLDDQYVSQLWIDLNAATPNMHVRTRVNGSWNAWRQVSMAGHTHSIGEVSSLQSALDGKAPLNHSHTINQVTGLQAALSTVCSYTTSSDAGLTDYPIGQIIAVLTTGLTFARNASATIRFATGSAGQTYLTTDNNGTVLAGTWRCKGRSGQINPPPGDTGDIVYFHLFQRVA